jgi:Protein of unknown function (DUF2752)
MLADVPHMVQTSPPNPQSRWGYRIVIVLLVAVAAPIAATILYSNSPSENTFYPGCVFNRVTGWHCPGCGATRCVYALLHLDIEQALAWNPLFVVLLPFVLFGLARMGFQMWTGRRLRQLKYWPRWGTKAVLWLLITYWILRNIPYAPFTLLAPHKLNGIEESVALLQARGNVIPNMCRQIGQDTPIVSVVPKNSDIGVANSR